MYQNKLREMEETIQILKLHIRKIQSVSDLDFVRISSKAGSVSLTITLVELWRQNGTFTFLVISKRLTNMLKKDFRLEKTNDSARLK